MKKNGQQESIYLIYKIFENGIHVKYLADTISVPNELPEEEKLKALQESASAIWENYKCGYDGLIEIPAVDSLLQLYDVLENRGYKFGRSVLSYETDIMDGEIKITGKLTQHNFYKEQPQELNKHFMVTTILFDKHDSVASTNFPESISLDNYIDLVKGNPTSKFNKGTTEYDNYKRTLSAILVNGYFTKNPSNDRFIKSTGFIFLELDNIDPEMVETEKRYWFDKYYFIAAIYKSLSQTGLHMIVKLDEKLTAEITAYKRDAFNPIIRSINNSYYEGKLDTQAFKLTQYTVIGSDINPLYRNEYSSLSIDMYEKVSLANSPAIKNAVYNPSNTIEEFDSLSRIKKLRFLIDCYPILKERYYWFNYDYGRVEPHVAEAFTAWGEMDGFGFTVNVNLQTSLSDDHFNSSRAVVVLEEPISVFKIWLHSKSKTGKRRNRLMIELSKLLFNNPFIGFENFKRELYEFNSKMLASPLNSSELNDIAEIQYKNFISGKMIWKNLILRKVFYPRITIIDADEKRKITSSVTYRDKKNLTIDKIRKAIVSLRQDGIKPTQRNVANHISLSLPTIKRHWSFVMPITEKVL